MIENDVLSCEEKASINLRGLYRRFGYQPYKMSRFEEYDLYAKNKDFLRSESIITFPDSNGHLLALKPDVTLSIVRSCRDQDNAIQRVYYNESVFRPDAGKNFKEITQVGVECIGAVDTLCLVEILTLAAQSLKLLSEECVLCISNLDIVAALLDRLKVPIQLRAFLMSRIGEKNLHEIYASCTEAGLSESAIKDLQLLASINGRPEDVFPVLNSIDGIKNEVAELRSLIEMLPKDVSEILRIDFSVTGDLRYYNGIVFRGYISGIPVSVITGGQYDRLMKKIGRKSHAIGFAVYLSSLELSVPKPGAVDVDTVLLYKETDNPRQVLMAAQQLSAIGKSVSIQKSKPEEMRCGKILRFTETGVTDVEDDA